MIEEGIGKIIGMAMAYAVSSLGLLLAYYNYRKRILKTEKVFSTAAWVIIAGVLGLAGAFVYWVATMDPIKEHGCLCVTVVNSAGQPLKGALVSATGGLETKRSGENGVACVTVKNSSATEDAIEVFASVRKKKQAYPENPVPAPETVASCMLKQGGCPDNCVMLPKTIRVDFAGQEWDAIKTGDVADAEKLKSGSRVFGIVAPILIFLFSFWVTWALYKHFNKTLGGE